jgi:glycosyltransferase involved in cell wall biosynthesis
MISSTCCIFNIAPHYNAPTYQAMDLELGCDFFLGDKLPYEIKKMNYNELKGFKGTLKNIFIISNFYWQVGALKNLFKPYKNYIFTGEPFCLSTWIILLLAKFTSKKTYLWSHGWYGDETLIKRVIKKAFFSLADGILLYGEYAKTLMISEGFEEKKLHVIYNSLDYSTQIKIKETLSKSDIYTTKFNNSNPVLLYIGRIQKIKKIEYIIEVLNSLKKKNIYYNFIIVGAEIEHTNLKELIAQYNLENQVWFLGECYEETVLSNLIYNADLTVSPGNVGLTAMHSLVYGTPVITHNNFSNQMPEFEVIETGKTGDFFKENDIEDLTFRIKSWIDTYQFQREIIRKNCFDRIAQHYNPEAQVKLLRNLLK